MRKGPSSHFLGGDQDRKDQVCPGMSRFSLVWNQEAAVLEFQSRAAGQGSERIGMIPNANLGNGRSWRVKVESGLPRPGLVGKVEGGRDTGWDPFCSDHTLDGNPRSPRYQKTAWTSETHQKPPSIISRRCC